MAFPQWFNRLLALGKKQRQDQQAIRVRSKKIKPTNEARSRQGTLSPEQKLLQGALTSETLREYTRGMYSIDSDLTTMFTSAVQDRRDYLETASELRRYPIASRILKILTQEILKPNDRGEILELVSEDEEIDKELKIFHEQQNLDNLLRMIVPDILNLGEYTLAIELGENGITAITDTVDQLSIITFYERGVPSNYLVWKTSDYYIEPPNKYCHFVIGEEKMRVAINDSLHRGYQIDFDKLPEHLRDKIPEFIRVGEPIFFAVVEKIRQLQILDQVVIATKLSAITQTKLISLQVPASMPVEKVMEACQKFEEMLNTQTGVDLSGELVTVAEIIGKAGRYTVIPNYTDEKGSLTPLDVRNDPQVDDVIKSIEDFRQVLLSCVGIPYKLVFGPRGNETEGSRGDEVRLYAMFSNMISNIQASLRNGVTQLVLTHLINKGYKVTAKDFEVIFKNASVNVGDLEKLEYDDAKQELVGRKIDFIQKMEENQTLGPNLNREGIYDWLEESFSELTNGIPMFKQHVGLDPETLGSGDPLELERNSRSVKRSLLKRKDRFMNKVVDTFKQKRLERAKAAQEAEDLLNPEKMTEPEEVVTSEPEIEQALNVVGYGNLPTQPVLHMTKDGTFENPPTERQEDDFETQEEPQDLSHIEKKKQVIDKVVDTFKKKRLERTSKEQQGKERLSEDIEDNLDSTTGEL